MLPKSYLDQQKDFEMFGFEVVFFFSTMKIVLTIHVVTQYDQIKYILKISQYIHFSFFYLSLCLFMFLISFYLSFVNQAQMFQSLCAFRLRNLSNQNPFVLSVSFCLMPDCNKYQTLFLIFFNTSI